MIVDVKDRLILPEDAVYLKEKGMVQDTPFAWMKIPSDEDPKQTEWALTFEPSENGFPAVIDWSERDNCYAAFDMADISIFLKSIGFYVSGPSFELEGMPRLEEQRFWADEITSVTEADTDVYLAYGPTEPAARGRLLCVLIETGRVPYNWQHYRIDKLSESMTFLRNKKNRRDEHQ